MEYAFEHISFRYQCHQIVGFQWYLYPFAVTDAVNDIVYNQMWTLFPRMAPGSSLFAMAPSPSTTGQMVSRSSTQSFKWPSSTAYTSFYLLRTTGFLSTPPILPQPRILLSPATIYLIITVGLNRTPIHSF